MDVPATLNWVEAETIRFAKRLMRPFSPQELAMHLRYSEQHVRRILHNLVDQRFIVVASGNKRYRTYRLP